MDTRLKWPVSYDGVCEHGSKTSHSTKPQEFRDPQNTLHSSYVFSTPNSLRNVNKHRKTIFEANVGIKFPHP